jgi:GTPase SAR1 family protein
MMMARRLPECEFEFKLILLGNAGVGKTALLDRFCRAR